MEYIGYWNIQTEEELAGTLKSSENGFRLELLGSFEDCLGSDIKQYKVIHGFTKCGKNISLFNCICSGVSCNMPGIPNVEYQCNEVFIGEKNYSDLEEIKIKSIQLSYDYLNEWIGMKSSTFTPDRQLSKIKFEARTLESINYKFDDYELDIKFTNSTNMNSLFTEFSWKQKSNIEITFNNYVLYQDALKSIYDFADFLSLNLGRPIQCKEINAVDINENKIHIIRRDMITPIKTMKISDVAKCLLSYRDIKDNFQIIYDNWIKKRVKLKPVISKMLMCEKEGKYFDVQLHFMNIITAVETFSRRCLNNCKIDEDEHKNRISTIMESIEKKEYKEWLEGKLRYSNEPTLKDRLLDIFNQTKFIIDGSGKLKRLVFKIVNTRNYYTHFGEDKSPKDMLSMVESYHIYNYLKLCLKILILKELDINVEELISNSSKSWCDDFRAKEEMKKLLGI